MRALVTGAAGFIGSHLCEALLDRGDEVVALDCFSDYYDAAIKEANAAAFADRVGARLVRADLASAGADILDGVEVVFHQAAQPGVRMSWAEGFPAYTRHNVLATQHLIELVRAVEPARRPRLVYASSSSVYGNAERFPTTEEDLPAPYSPYGVTKLAGEHLCSAYAANFGLATISLRYFTVYGPRQRPDMAFHRLLEAGLGGEAFPLYGEGSQIRQFTYVADVVRANLLAAEADAPPGLVVNISGGASVSLAEMIELAGELLGHPVPLDRRPPQPGDARETGGSTDRARATLGWQPDIGVRDGLAAQLAWHRARRS